jgi:hypothetical protein
VLKDPRLPAFMLYSYLPCKAPSLKEIEFMLLDLQLKAASADRRAELLKPLK